VQPLAVADEDVLGLDARKRLARGPRPKQRMHTERLLRGPHVGEGAEGVGHDERAALRPPEGNLAPEAATPDRAHLERGAREPVEGSLVDRNAVPRRECVGVPAMAVEQEDDAGRLAEAFDPPLDARSLERVEEVDPAVNRERVRGTGDGVGALVDPAEAEVRLVAEADRGLRQAKTSRTLRRPAARRSISSGRV
jgi:hypothetical protein